MSSNCGNRSLPSVADWMPDTKSFFTQQGSRIPFGISELDAVVPTIAGKYVVVSGNAGVGKTDFAITLAVNSLISKRPTLFLSLELGIKPVLSRMMSLFSNVIDPLTDVQVRSKEEYDDLDDTKLSAFDSGTWLFDEYKQYLFLDDGSKQGNNIQLRNVEGIRTHARSIMHEFEQPCLVVCDYFQLLQTKDNVGTNTDRLDRVSYKLASFAHETGCPLIVPASINKDGSIRGSMQVFYDCDINIELKFGRETARGSKASSTPIRPMQATVNKNRDGEVGGTIRLDYRPASHRFTSRGEVW